MKREGDIRIYNTNLSVWEGPVDEKGMRAVMRGVLGRLRKLGFSVQVNPKVLERHPSIADGYWVAARGELRAIIEQNGRHLKVEFYQDINVQNQNGGRYDFSKYQRMPRTMQLECIIVMHALVQKLQARGYLYRLKNRDPVEPTMLDIRDFIDPPNCTGTLESFNDGWNSEFDWARGGRFERDETGWPTAEVIGCHTDRDGVPIVNGETRYVYYRGNLMRGAVRTNMNGMWSVGDFTYVPSGYLFLCDPATVPRRSVSGQPKRLRSELEKALKRGDYGRVEVLARVIRLEEAANTNDDRSE